MVNKTETIDYLLLTNRNDVFSKPKRYQVVNLFR